jgi:integrase
MFAYSRGFKKFLPASQELLCLWVADLSKRVQPATIKGYLSAVRSLHIEHGLKFDIGDRALLDRIMLGVKRNAPDKSRRKRLPITTSLIKQFSTRFKLHLYNHAVLFAALCTAVGGLFRPSEVCPRSASQPDRLLTLKSLKWEAGPPLHFTIHLNQSKADSEYKGVTVRVMWPVAVNAMQHYLSMRPRSAVPLFALSDGSPLLYRALIDNTTSLVRVVGIDMRQFRGISFRAGGATSLADAGADSSTIQSCGRWKSQAFKLYVDANKPKLAEAALQM